MAFQLSCVPRLKDERFDASFTTRRGSAEPTLERRKQRASTMANYRFTAIPCTSNRASKSKVPAPTNARGGNSFVKYVR